MPLILLYLPRTGFNVQSCLCKLCLTHAFTTGLLSVGLCEAFFLCTQQCSHAVPPSSRVQSHTPVLFNHLKHISLVCVGRKLSYL